MPTASTRAPSTCPRASYEYKVALNGTWDVNYGPNGELNSGSNIAYTHPGGPITFYFDPRTNIVQNTSEGPIVTLPGSYQSELGCAGDWAPDCLASLMADGDKDGVYEFSTDEIPSGAYETKVAHGLSWNESYGPPAQPGRQLLLQRHRRASSWSSATRSRRTCSRSS